MSDKSFKVKSGLTVPALSTAGIVKTDSSGVITSSATLGLSEGGTGQTTAANALNALLPLQTNKDNYYLQTNGVTPQWNQILAPVYSADAPSSPVVGQIWVESDSTSDSFDPNIIRRKSFTATAAQTTFTTDVPFIQGYEQVFFNGMLLVRNNDYTTTNDTTVVLTTGAAVNDVVEVVTITNLNSINAATTTTNTFTGNQVVNASNNSIEASSRIRSKEGFRVTGNNGTNEYQIGPFYNFTDFQITHSTDGFTTHSPRLTIDSNGNTSSLFNQSFANSSYAGKNAIINGAMDIWQRGTSFPSGVGLGSATVYSADRWHWYRGGNDSGATLTRQSAGIAGFQYCIRMQRNAGNSSTQVLGLRYTAETADSVRFAGKAVTLSFWARKGANYSGSSNTFRATVATGTGTDQVVHSFTGFALIVDQNVTLTDTWQKFTLTGTAASNATQIGLEMFHTPTGTAGANDYMEITGIQLEEGSIATPFSRATGTTQGELAACQRYFQILGDNIYELIYGGYMTSGTVAYISFPYPVTMRITPVGTIIGSWAILNIGQPVIQATFPHAISLRATSTTTGQFYFHSNTTYYLTMNAEL